MVALAIAILIAACGFCDPDNRPTTIPGQTNGRLPASVLTAVNSNCSAYTPAANDLKKLVIAAEQAGIVITPGQCYRDYANQVYWRNYWCNLGQCQKAAVPGTSNHGWGKAVDIRNLEFGTREYTWMENNAWQFNWNHPGWAAQGQSAAEPWHWEWVGDGGTMFAKTGGASVQGHDHEHDHGHDHEHDYPAGDDTPLVIDH
jgi:hypothetical protein